MRAHFHRLEQVTVNLSRTPARPSPTPSKGSACPLPRREAGRVRLVVADAGRGMSPELLERIKDPFFTTKHDMGGVGLGVSISESIIAEYGGAGIQLGAGAGHGRHCGLRAPAAGASGREAGGGGRP